MDIQSKLIVFLYLLKISLSLLVFSLKISWLLRKFYLHYLTTHTNLSTIRRGFAPDIVSYKKRVHSTRRCVIKFTSYSLGTPASSTTKTGRHDIAEILLKVTLNTINQSINITYCIGINHLPYFACVMKIYFRFA